MKLRNLREVAAQEVEEGARGVTIRWLIARPEGAPNFALRYFEVTPGGYTPLHSHSWEHEVYILEGQAEITLESGPAAAQAGDAILIEPGETHQFRNRGAGVLRFLCMVPLLPEKEGA